MAKFSPTTQRGDCEEIAHPAYGRRRHNWIDSHGSVPQGQVVDPSCGNQRCIALRHPYLRPRLEQPGTYRKLADRVHRLKVGQYFDVPGVGTRSTMAATFTPRSKSRCVKNAFTPSR